VEYDEWERSVPHDLTADAIWRRQDYRLATYVADVGWVDADQLSRHPATRALADQLYRALTSIGANLAEGYSRSGGADRVRFYEYALGSARESREWYYKARHVLSPNRAAKQCTVLTSIIRLILTAIPVERRERGSAARSFRPKR
jgi:four helix bundle protein